VDELVWGYPIVFHLFLVSLGAGVLAVSAYLVLWRSDDPAAFALARYGAFLAPLPLLLDGLVLILDLGSFHAGYWFKFLNLYKIVTASPMSIGTWLITAFIIISLLYAHTFLRMPAGPDDPRVGRRRGLAWAGLAVALTVAAYPGFLLSGMQARPFWNSPLVPLVYFFSALVLGIACKLLFLAWRTRSTPTTKDRGDGPGLTVWLARIGTYLSAGELLLVILFVVFAHRGAGSVTQAVTVIMGGGVLATVFWFWAVAVGLVLPMLIMMVAAFRPPATLEGVLLKAVEIAAPLLLLFGAFMLRYVFVVAGQITGPVGL